MSLKLHILLITLLFGCIGRSQLYLPLTTFYTNNIEENAFADTNFNDTYYKEHLSLKPILDQRTDTDVLYNKEGKHYYWITQKLFKENFIVFEGDGFWVSIDPILDLELGIDLAADSLSRLYWNTRGIRIQGKFMDKVGFTTSIYENQAFVPDYQANYADNHGEFFPNSLNTKYIQNNAVIAGYARTKPFKNTGYDFAFAEGNVSYVPNKFINFQLGNGNHFVGNGYRSLLLSDFAVNYPFAKIEANLMNGRLQYNAIYALHQNLYRLTEFTTPEATYEKKIGTYHYLDFAVTKNLQIGLFEGSVWRRVDSLGSHKPDALLTNPIILINTAAKGFDNDGFHSIIGLNAGYDIGNHGFYGQAVFDNGQLGGYQLGYKFYQLINGRLDGGIEYNHVELNTYLSADRRYNYSHYNLPLAHPFVNGFDELSINLTYQENGVFMRNRFSFSQRVQNDSMNIGNNILLPFSTNEPTDNRTAIVIYNQLELGYRFNKRNNLQVFVGHLYRNETQPTENPVTNYTYLGVRTRLKNKYLDF